MAYVFLYGIIISKRAAGEGGFMLNGDCNSNSRASKIVKHDAMDHRQEDGLTETEFTSLETVTATAAPDMKNLPPSDSSQTFKVISFLSLNKALRICLNTKFIS